jgi:cytochrome P450
MTTHPPPRPPIAKGLPFIGSAGQVARAGMIPFILDQWRTHGDIFRMKLGPQMMVVIAHPDGVARVLASHRENYVKGRSYDTMRLMTGDGLLTLEGEPWLRRRRLEQPSFHRESIRRLTEAMVRVTDRAIARWRRRLPEGGEIEAHRAMMGLTLEVVGETLFGQTFGEETTDASARAFSEALGLMSERSNRAVQLPLAIPTPRNLRLRRALRALDEKTFEIIAHARKRRDPAAPATLLTMLLEAKDADTGEGLSDGELRNEVITLFLAGHETTALLLTWGFTLLGRHPDVVAKMRAEVAAVLGDRDPVADDLPALPYLRQVIDEILRLRSPTWTVARDVMADDVLLGHQVRAGETVLPCSYLAHRHPAFWEEPERFDPERFTPERTKARPQGAYFPFSLGPRMCIGNVFSLVEAQVVLAMLLRRADFELAPGPLPEPVAQITLRPKGPVNLRLAWREGAKKAAPIDSAERAS